MNKYIKVLTLSAGLVGIFAPSIATLNNKVSDNLNNLYESVENVNTTSYIAKNLKVGVSKQNQKSNSIDEQTELVQDETINYLNDSLEKTNTEYQNLRKTLIEAINQTNSFLQQCKESDLELSDEQKLYIKEQSNNIKYLANTLNSLNQQVIDCMDGCEDCQNYDKITSMYIFAIQNLEQQIQALQNSLISIQGINGYLAYNLDNYDNDIVYGLHFGKSPFQTDDNCEDCEDNKSEDLDEQENTDEQINNNNANNEITDNENITNNQTKDIDSNTNNKAIEDNTVLDNDKIPNNDMTISPNNQTEEVATDDDKGNIDSMKNFGIKPNIDTYEATNKNIDTFFNTALIDNDFMYGGGGAPYGGYNMPYNRTGYGYYNNGYNQPYNNINSNAVADNEFNMPSNELNDKGNSSLPTNPGNKKEKRSKNVDTYTETTIEPNINTMGQSRLSQFLKDKYNQLRDKIKNRKQDNNNFNITHKTKDIQENDIKPNTSNEVDNKLDDVKDTFEDIKDKFDDKLDTNYDLSTLEEPIIEDIPTSAIIDELDNIQVEQYHFPKMV